MDYFEVTTSEESKEEEYEVGSIVQKLMIETQLGYYMTPILASKTPDIPWQTESELKLDYHKVIQPKGYGKPVFIAQYTITSTTEHENTPDEDGVDSDAIDQETEIETFILVCSWLTVCLEPKLIQVIRKQNDLMIDNRKSRWRVVDGHLGIGGNGFEKWFIVNP